MWCCHHSDVNKGRSSTGESRKGTHCNAKIDITVKLITKDTKKKDHYLKLNPPLCAIVIFTGTHNHDTNSIGSLRYLPMTDPQIKAKFLNLFADGLSPGESIRAHENEIMIGKNPIENLANGSINPMPRAVYRLWQEWKQAEFGSVSTPPLKKLAEKADFYNEKGISVVIREEQPWCVLVVTNIMQRAQQLRSSTEIIFIDSTSSCDSTHANFTVVLTATKAGAVPVAVLIHADCTIVGYSAAFQLLIENFPACFGGRNSPAVFMTDDSRAEKTALTNIFPSAKQFLCHFHMAQAEWRWLMSASSGVGEHERQELMGMFQKVMYAKSEDDLHSAIDQVDDQQHQEKFVARLHSNLERKEEWVALYRTHTVTRSRDTNNFAEATIRVMKDIILNRTKAFNVVALVEFVGVVWEQYSTAGLLSFAHNRRSRPHIMYEALCTRMKAIDRSKVRQVSESEYEVPSASDQDTRYFVNVDVGMCSCPSGNRGSFCKHQAYLHKEFKTPFPNVPAVTQEERYDLGKLALGDMCPPKEFFKGLKDSPRKSVQHPAELHMDEEPEDHTAMMNIVDHSEEEDEDAEIEYTEAKSKVLNQFERIGHLMESNHSTLHTKHLTKLAQQLSKVTNVNLATEMLMSTTALLSKKTRSGGKIRVQPPALARRRAGATRGSTRIASGRPSLNPAVKRVTKRCRNLRRNINLNVGNAKSHGVNH